MPPKKLVVSHDILNLPAEMNPWGDPLPFTSVNHNHQTCFLTLQAQGKGFPMEGPGLSWEQLISTYAPTSSSWTTQQPLSPFFLSAKNNRRSIQKHYRHQEVRFQKLQRKHQVFVPGSPLFSSPSHWAMAWCKHLNKSSLRLSVALRDAVKAMCTFLEFPPVHADVKKDMKDSCLFEKFKLMFWTKSV